MADTQEAIRRLSIESKTVGVTQSTAELNALAQAQGGVAVASSQTERASLSLDQKFQQLERRYNSQVRASQDYEKVQRQVNAAVSQNPALQERANQILAAAAERYGQVGGAQKAMSIASQTLNLQVAALAGNLGITGQVLSAFGPMGFAAAVGLGAVQGALGFVSEQTHALAQKAKEISEFSEATGLTVRQFQALRSEAGKFGVDSEALSQGVSKFTAGFNELRLGQGQLLTDIRRINPALADQMQGATDAATAFTLFGRAVAQTDNIFQRNALLKSALGKGSATFGAFFESGPDVARLTAAFDEAGKGIDENLIKKLKQLQIDIDKTRSAASSIFASSFGTSTLEAEKQYAVLLLDIAKTFKTISEFNFPSWLSESAEFAGKLVLKLTPLGAIVQGLVALRGLAAAGAAVQDNKFAPGGDPMAASSYGGKAGPSSIAQAIPPSSVITADAYAKKLQEIVGVLGSAASPQEKLNAALAELGIKARDAGASSEYLARAEAALRQDNAISVLGARTAALGAAASNTDLLAQKTLQLAQANRAGAGLSAAEVANQIRLTTEQNNGVGAVNAQIDALKIQQATLGMSAGAAAEYTAIESRRLEDLRNGKPVDEAATAALRERAKALREAADENVRARTNAQISFDRQTAFLSPQDLRIAQQLREQFNNNIPAALESSEAAAIRFNDSLKSINDTIRDAAQAFTKDLIGGLIQGKSLMSSLGQAATNLSAKLTDKAIESLFSGDFLSAGVQGLGALVTGLFGADQKRKEEEAKAAAAAAQRAADYNARAQLAGLDTSTLKGQLAQFDIQAAQQRAAEAAQGNRAIVELEHALAAERKAILDKTVADSRKALDAVGAAQKSDVAQKLEAIKSASADLSAALTALGSSGGQGSIQAVAGDLYGMNRSIQALGASAADVGNGVESVAASVAAAVARVKAAFDADLQSQINAASGQGYLNDIKTLLDQRDQLLSDSAALGSDPAQVTRYFEAKAQSIVDGAQLSGDAFAELQKQFPLLTGVVHAFTGSLKEMATQIREYLTSLNAGSLSVLTPEQKLAAAGSSFNQTLSQARGGDQDAIKRLTSTANDYLTSAKDFFASSQGYSDIFASVTAALNSLQQQLQATVGGAANGGLIPGLAGGGMVGNGVFNVDSVRARYAGGGDIALAGGEFVNRASSVNAATLPTLHTINQTGRVPGNDNGAHFASLGQTLVRGMAGASMAQINAMRQDNADLRALVGRLIQAVEASKPKAPRPSSRTGTGS